MKVCFIRLFAGPLFFPDQPGGIGGAEVRATTFARTLAARREHEISFVLSSHGPQASHRVDDITLHFLPKRRESKDRAWNASLAWQWPTDFALKAIRSVRQRLTSRPEALRFFRELDADVFACFGPQPPMSGAIAAAQVTGKKSILFLIHDDDIAFPELGNSRRERREKRSAAWRRFAIDHADEVVVQTEFQQEAVRTRFGRAATLIRNPIATDGAPPPRPPDVPARYVLWIGRSDRFHKRSDLLLQLAHAHPDIPFVVVLNKDEPTAYEEFLAGRPPNVTLLDRVPFTEVEQYYAHAAALLNTSNAEGFPNAFLQAAKHGTPIVSLRVDPDGMLAEHGCGLVAGGDMREMGRLLRDLWNQPRQAASMAAAGRRFVDQRHSLAGRVDELNTLLRRLSANAPQRRSA